MPKTVIEFSEELATEKDALDTRKRKFTWDDAAALGVQRRKELDAMNTPKSIDGDNANTDRP